ncbi:MAG: cysteine--tRNA ligase [Patescibacteria group bacterium]
MKVFNSLSKKVEDFKPISPELVTMYTCGPTVYDFQHIGNFRTFAVSDLVLRTLKFNDYNVRFIMNLTDVGHLTGDNQGDADTGVDRMEMAAEREGKSVKDISNYYTRVFLEDFEKLNLQKPEKFTKASEYIQEQIDLVKTLEKRGFTYKISDGIYFDTSKYKSYGLMSGLTSENVLEGARVEPNAEKKNPTDFALWKFSPLDQMRWQEWDSPWGRGFPGWHAECSAMILKELGETIDIHMGGEDHKMIHHPNEMAQSECATGKRFVNYFMHVSHLQVDGGRMGKSLGNAYTLSDLEAKSFEPLALRYFYLSAHYRSKLNFTFQALQGAQNALRKLYDLVSSFQEDEDAVEAIDYLEQFKHTLDDDLNTPKALAVMWDMIKSDIPEASKIVTLLKFDEVLGLNLDEYVGFDLPQKVIDLAKIRWTYKKSGIWDKADTVRREIEELGFYVEDTTDNYRIKRKLD